MRFVVEAAGIDDDLLVIAGDNLFEFSLADYVALLAHEGRGERARGPRRRLDSSSRRHYGVVELAADDRIVDFVEKPERPAVHAGGDGDATSSIARTCR